MAISLRARRVAAVEVESARGTYEAITPSADALPLIREATPTIEPVSVNRPTLRLSLTKYANIYPGQARLNLDILMELHGIPQGDADYETPVWGDLMRACGFEELSNTLSDDVHAYTGFTSHGGSDGAPWRHGETITASYATSGGPITGPLVGDTYFDDDIMFVNETSGTAGTGAITLTGGTSSLATDAGTVVRDAANIVAWRQRSDVNNMETVSMELYVDGKRWRMKGAMGNVEIQCNHGDAILGRFQMQGIYEAYGDASLPTNPNEVHNVPPTFLGKDFRVSYFDGSNTRRYGRDGASTLGSINSFSITPGNQVVLRENSFDTAGFSFSLITAREGTGAFNPDEVLSGSPDNFDFISRFVAGNTFRLRAFIGDAPNTDVSDTNTIDVIAPGLVFSGMADQDRDGINVWDASFALTGGDYDTTAAGELPGNDNELTIVYR